MQKESLTQFRAVVALTSNLFSVHSMPHPSEPVLHIRIQMYGSYATNPFMFVNPASPGILQCLIDGLSSLDALLEALDNLENVVDAIESAYNKSLGQGNYTTHVERL